MLSNRQIYTFYFKFFERIRMFAINADLGEFRAGVFNRTQHVQIAHEEPVFAAVHQGSDRNFAKIKYVVECLVYKCWILDSERECVLSTKSIIEII